MAATPKTGLHQQCRINQSPRLQQCPQHLHQSFRQDANFACTVPAFFFTNPHFYREKVVFNSENVIERNKIIQFAN